MLIHGICQENSFIVRPRQYQNHDNFQEHSKLTAMVNTIFTHVSGQGAIVPTTNVRTFSNMSITGYLAGCPNEKMITHKMRQTVPEDSSSFLEGETGQTEARVSSDAELLSNSSSNNSWMDEQGWRRLVKSAERIDSVA